MANAWVETDFQLQKILAKYVTGIAAESAWTWNLYKNNHVPVVGDVAGDYTPADFAGYTAKTQAPSAFGTPTVTAHVAKTVSSTAIVFGPSTEATASQTIYGYYVVDSSGNYLFAEMFTTAISVAPGGSVTLTSEIRHQNQT